jgi:hypothetical protein
MAAGTALHRIIAREHCAVSRESTSKTARLKEERKKERKRKSLILFFFFSFLQLDPVHTPHPPR